MKYEDVTHWKLPEPQHFDIIAGILRGAMEDFAEYIAENDPETAKGEILMYLREWSAVRQIPVADGDKRFWEDILMAPRERPPMTSSVAVNPNHEELIKAAILDGRMRRD